MYFRINHSGCSERKGLCEIRYDFYLDPEDYGYEQHYVQVPVWPPDSYSGQVDDMGSPVDQSNYDKWFNGLPRIWQNNPFCCHFFQFEPTVTDEEILASGEKFLKMAYENWQKGDLNLNKNESVNLLPLDLYRTVKPFTEAVIGMAVKGKPLDYEGDALAVYLDNVAPIIDKKPAHMVNNRIHASQNRINSILTTDFDSLAVQ